MNRPQAGKARGLLAISCLSDFHSNEPKDLVIWPKDHGALSTTLASNTTWLMLVGNSWRVDGSAITLAFDYASTTP